MSDSRLSSGLDSTFGRDPSASSGTGGPVTYELASWGVRAVALVLDALVVGLAAALVFGIGISLFESDPDQQRRIAEQYAYPIALVLSALYSPLLMLRRGERNGQTLGKQAMRIRVVSESGLPVTLGVGLMREVVGRMVPSLLTFGLYTPVDYLWPLWDRNRQCLHDKFAKTRVVRVGSPSDDDGGSSSVPAAAGPAASPAGLAPAPAPPPHRDEDDRPVREGWLPPSAGS